LRVRVLSNNSVARWAAWVVVHAFPEWWDRVCGAYAGIVTLKIAGVDLRYALGPSDPIGDRLYWCGEDVWEPGVVRVFAALAKHAQGCILDIGANCGIYSLLACAVNPNVRVRAWEPVPLLRGRIALSSAENGFEPRLEVRSAAAGARSGEATFYLHPDPTQGGFTDTSREGQSMTVQVEAIDDVVPPVEHVALIKIDVEGHEIEALSGLTRILETNRPPVIFECLDTIRWPKIALFFNTRNYALSAISDREGLLPTGEFVTGITNYLAEPKPVQ